jgi:citrate lyase alpha subunit
MRLIVNPIKYGNTTGRAPQIRNTEFELDASFVGVPIVTKRVLLRW